MAIQRKYQQTTGYYAYVHITPDKMCYFGMSKQQPIKRWAPSHYKNTSLQPGIEEFGWDNIEHMVIQDGLTKHQAEVIEDWFITKATKDGFCINKNESGGKWRDNPKEYNRECQCEYRKKPEVKAYQREYNREYQKTEKRKAYLREYGKKRNQTEKCKEYKREYNQRPEVKERNREYHHEYHKTEKYKEYQRQYRLKKKQQTIKEQ